jgi:hypothetical protein
MQELLARVRALFVVPAVPAVPASRPVARFAPAPAVALLCQPRHALAGGAALALTLARDAQAGKALVCVWRAAEGDVPGLRVPATRPARRLVSSLAAHGLEAVASGRLARLPLPEDPGAAAAVAARATAVAAAPTVLALAGPRSAVLDRVLAAQDLVVVSTSAMAGAALADLARESVAELGVPAVACELSAGPRARAIAAAGLAAPGVLRSAFAPAVEAVR